MEGGEWGRFELLSRFLLDVGCSEGAVLVYSLDVESNAFPRFALRYDVHYLWGSVRVEDCQPVIFGYDPIATFDAVAHQRALARVGSSLLKEFVAGVLPDTADIDNVPTQRFGHRGTEHSRLTFACLGYSLSSWVVRCPYTQQSSVQIPELRS